MHSEVVINQPSVMDHGSSDMFYDNFLIEGSSDVDMFDPDEILNILEFGDPGLAVDDRSFNENASGDKGVGDISLDDLDQLPEGLGSQIEDTFRRFYGHSLNNNKVITDEDEALHDIKYLEDITHLWGNTEEKAKVILAETDTKDHLMLTDSLQVKSQRIDSLPDMQNGMPSCDPFIKQTVNSPANCIIISKAHLF